jgi:hypothetical protein
MQCFPREVNGQCPEGSHAQPDGDGGVKNVIAVSERQSVDLSRLTNGKRHEKVKHGNEQLGDPSTEEQSACQLILVHDAL